MGRIAIGRIDLRRGPSGAGRGADADRRSRHAVERIVTVYTFEDLGRTEVSSAGAGDIVALVGLEGIEIGDTLSDPEIAPVLPHGWWSMNPTLKMTFGVNTSPLAGLDGRYRHQPSPPRSAAARSCNATWP